MVGRLSRSFAFACMNAYVVGCLLFINGACAAVGAGVVAFAVCYIGHIAMILDALRADFAQISRSRAALRAWATRNTARGMFGRLDQNSDGVLSPQEFSAASARAGASAAQIDAMFSKMDEDKSGTLDEKEFTTFLQVEAPLHPFKHPLIAATAATPVTQVAARSTRRGAPPSCR